MDPDSGVIKIGGTNHCPEGIRIVKAKWEDDNDIIHTYYLKKALYFPSSPVNIISVTSLAEQLEDDKGMFVTMKRKYLMFTWENEKGTPTIPYYQHSLPEIAINT
eukprot:9501047-Ditylum_brightwellii.AAC.1